MSDLKLFQVGEELIIAYSGEDALALLAENWGYASPAMLLDSMEDLTPTEVDPYTLVPIRIGEVPEEYGVIIDYGKFPSLGTLLVTCRAKDWVEHENQRCILASESY